MTNLSKVKLNKTVSALHIKTVLCLIVSFIVAMGSISVLADSYSDYVVSDGEQSCTVSTNSNDAPEIASNSALDFDGFDHAELVGDSAVLITRRCNITVDMYGEKKSFVVVKDTVKNVLAAIGVKTDDDDVISPSTDSIVNDGDVIKVKKIEIKSNVSVSEINYKQYLKIVKKNGMRANIGSDAEKIRATIKYIITYENGVKTKVVVDSAKFKVLKKRSAYSVKSSASGTISPLSGNVKLNDKGVPVKYNRVYRGIGSAYSGGGYTASGRPAAVGYVAVDPNEIPYGSRLFIRSTDGRYIYGYAIAADTGGFVNMGRLVDLYFSTEWECEQFGLRNVEVYVLG